MSRSETNGSETKYEYKRLEYNTFNDNYSLKYNPEYIESKNKEEKLKREIEILKKEIDRIKRKYKIKETSTYINDSIKY